MADPEFGSLVDLLAHRVAEAPGRQAYTMVDDELREFDALTYATLDSRARALAARLSAHEPGARVLVLVPHGLDFLVGLFACVYSGLIAIPAPAPEPAQWKQQLPRLRAIGEDARPAVVVSAEQNTEVVLRACAEVPSLAGAEHLVLGRDDAGEERAPLRLADPGEAAYLQYTSGSTASPKGVMISQRNLLVQAELIRGSWDYGPDCLSVGWMPYFHDYGLIEGLIQPLYAGLPTVMMTPMTFLKSPAAWLRAVSRFKATHSAGPVFAYDYAVKRVQDRHLAELDLSGWLNASIGAERVHERTLTSFTERFAPAGFRRDAFRPSFGLAEYTLMATTRPLGDRATILPARAPGAGTVDGARYESPWPLVGCGHPALDTQLRVVDPATRRECAPGEVGEIWLAGASAALGYWNRPRETAETFEATLDGDESDQRYLRTGDLGLLHDGELFVTGRLKELVIVQGVNHHPEDIERAAATADPGFAGLRGAAFATETLSEDGTERVVLVHETNARALSPEKLDELAATVRAVVSAHCGVDVHALVLVRRGGVPKTTSGKVQRTACRRQWLDGSLGVVAEWRRRDVAPPAAAIEARPDAARLRAWLVEKTAVLGGVDPAAVDVSEPLARYGLTSVVAAQLVTDLSQLLGTRVEVVEFYEHPTIAALAAHLADPARRTSPVTTAPVTAAPAPTSPAEDRAAEPEPVAIVGMGLRLPGKVRDPGGFWRLLRDGRDVVGEVPAQRWRPEEHYDPDPAAPGRSTTRWGAFLDDVDRFDARFFGISRREAVLMDPQQRLLLEVTQEALDDAGVPRESLRGSDTGVFAGVGHPEYAWLQHEHPELADGGSATGAFSAIAANRLSYHYDLRGPSFTVDAVCSSALLALHLGARSVASGECERAIVAGANLTLGPDMFVWFSKLGVMSPDGRCRTFDADGNGIVFGEGVVTLVLRPLAQALADGDRVYALVRGSAAVQEGRTNGLTAPGREGQETLLRKAYRAAGVAAGQVHYVEAHGTGTPVGDPVEVHALGAVLGEDRPAERPCLVGSVKTNLGHLGVVGGLAGVVKVALALKHRQLPPSLHFRRENPALGLAERKLAVADRLMPWPAAEPGLAGVTSLSFGGTDVHVVLEEAPPATRRENAFPAGEPHLLAVSAHDERALRQLAGRFARLADDEDGPALADLCYSATVRRGHYAHRLATVAGSTEEIAEALTAFAEGTGDARISHGLVRSLRPAEVAFVFSGQGTWHPGVGQRLLRCAPAFRAELVEWDRRTRELAGVSVLDLLGEHDAEVVAPHRQVLAFVQQAALAALWRAAGVEPVAVAGHSLGEVTAAYVAGALSREDALRIVIAREAAVRRCEVPSSMASVSARPEELAKLLAEDEDPGTVVIAAVNGPQSTVLSGARNDLARVLAGLAARGITAREFSIGFPAHNPLLLPFADAFAADIAGIAPAEPRVPMISTVTGTPVTAAGLGVAHWVDNLIRPVRFTDAFDVLAERGTTAFLEVGTHPVLTPAMEEQAEDTGRDVVVLASSRKDAETATWLSSLGRLYTLGAPIRWDQVYPTGNLVRLPGQQWQRERFWLTDELPERPVAPVPERAGRIVPLTGADLVSLRQHRVRDTALLPAAAYPVLAFQETGGPVALANLVLHAPRPLPGGDDALRITVTGDRISFGDTATCERAAFAGPTPALPELSSTVDEPLTVVPGPAHDRLLRARGARYGVAYRTVTEVTRRDGEAEGRLLVTPQSSAWTTATAVLDGAFQVAYATLSTEDTAPLFPVRIERVRQHRLPDAGEYRVRARLVRAEPGENAVVDLVLQTVSGEPVAEISGLELRLSTEPHAAPVGRVPEWWRLVAPPGPADPGRWLVLGDDALAAALPGDPAGDVTGIVYVLDALEADPVAAAQRIATEVFGLLGDRADTTLPRLCLVTRGACAVTPADAADPARLAAGVLPALARSVRAEFPDTACGVVDLDPEGPGDPAGVLGLLGREPVVAVRGGEWYVPRLVPAEFGRAAGRTGGTWQLAQRRTGVLEPFVRHVVTRGPLGPGEVDVAVAAAGLGFRDALKALGNYPVPEDGPAWFGDGFAGTVTAVGEDVTHVRPGDRVFGVGTACLAGSVRTLADLVVPAPAAVTDEEAAAAMPYLTAWYSLVTTARLAEGETMLVHSAASGTGLAAVHVARSLGARVLATAGTEEKREYLRSLGVELVLDSRGPGFGDQVRRHTGGRGVDVVLNSLSGSAIAESLSALARYGRFVELGRRDIEDDAPLNLGGFREDLTFAAVGIARVFFDRPELIGGLLRALAHRLADGTLPPLPARSFPVSRAEEAFRVMARGTHIGTLAVTVASAAGLTTEATYLVTGGLGHLGLLTAGRLLARGVRRVALLGRHAPTAEVTARLSELDPSGERITVHQADVTDRAALETVLAGFDAGGPPLRGIVHAAGVSDDGIATAMTAERVAAVLAPKAAGAWHLHELTADRELDAFVLYSSVAAVLGSPGQANYAAANGFLDALAAHRAARGLVATSVGWGPWTGPGEAAARGSRHWAARGVATLSEEDNLRALDAVLDGAPVQAAVFARADGVPALAEPVREAFAEPGTGPEDLDDWLLGEMAVVLSSQPDRLSPDDPFSELGFDSLTALELRNRIEARWGVKLPATLLWRYPTPAALAAHLTERLDEVVVA
ncbi:SDR family NAD(P)-dependent oxidoreductase [Amycolatopsis sp., V23-08]|uniref:SDR family NAD(P)-dependent oxidoreductase n=1 Tax=Amycolatopsis heterodermiae TaxID=3110235 RepID=A0ABU5R2C9_9PSEU|nr:SDR family NAD(P)-dependent oxidoreductase [Amycolatopsis sp., V23-08]MEA5360343.1 SDR family NAD(P)-dependent oxidoreductase [Amycolatopsis sp., V23-08]